MKNPQKTVSLIRLFNQAQLKVAFTITLLTCLIFLGCACYILKTLITHNIQQQIEWALSSSNKPTNNQDYSQTLKPVIEHDFALSIIQYDPSHQLINIQTTTTPPQSFENMVNFVFFKDGIHIDLYDAKPAVSLEVQLRSKNYLFYYWLLLSSFIVTLTFIPIFLFFYLYKTRKFLEANTKPLIHGIHTFTQTEKWQRAPFTYIREFQIFNTTFNTLIEKFESTKQNLNEHNDQLNYQAHHDVLTQIPNRHYFQQFINRELNQNLNHYLVLLYIDNNKFKAINDTYGHQMGDAVLIETTQRLKRNLPKDAFIARLGGDEFAVVLKTVKDTQQLKNFCQKLIESCYEPLVVDDQPIYFTFSIGASYAYHAKNLDELLHQADEAMYQAKASGRHWAIFNPQYFEDHLF
ncbi:diguanylate cyclase [Acinetobacter wanghuae]|uniref:Diguanylate cyclase n=1 Tax=Acinetobacter wanghuae TaxID=2662362 RepID=A0A5Q0P5Z0_9GAMM|nr:GGDEF domain-containing protein [Acinetobacter wanghuae]MQW92834.1 diguanylate cyclase [Acinetobacter wanghuae]QGA11790.1 diguanylate cyclase [Acinetobacter wanghuae]